jgi:hypothetical protein
VNPSTVGDDDGDGYYSCTDDCNDADANVYPNAPENWYDGIDQNCDGLSDYDQDGDGYLSINNGGVDCDDTDASTYGDDDLDGYLSCQDDCDDSDEFSYDGATEICEDGIDQDCDGSDASCNITGTVRTVAGTWLDISYEVCGSGGCNASEARTACTNVGKKVVSHASDGSSSVYSLGASSSCQHSISYYTVDITMGSDECLVAVSNLDWSQCCTMSNWHGNTLSFGTVGSVFGYTHSGNSGYSSSYSNSSGTGWGCHGLSNSAGTMGSCSTYFVACH